MLARVASAVLLASIIGCNEGSERDKSSHGNGAVEQSEVQQDVAKLLSTSSTDKLPEYLGVFYIASDSLIRIFDERETRLTVRNSRPRFYVFGDYSTQKARIEQTARETAGWGWDLRAYPMKHPSDMRLFRLELPPGVDLTPEVEYGLTLGPGFLDKTYFRFKVVAHDASPRNKP